MAEDDLPHLPKEEYDQFHRELRAAIDKLLALFDLAGVIRPDWLEAASEYRLDVWRDFLRRLDEGFDGHETNGPAA